MNKLLTEFIGTFFLVLTVCMTAFGGVVPAGFAPIAIGSALMIMVYAGGHISGGHYNPAVSLGIFLRGKIQISEMFTYWLAQFAGAAVAALVAKFLLGTSMSSDVAYTGSEIARAIVAEVIGTFALVYVVLNVATSPKTAGNSYFGLAIGFTVMVMAFAIGSISGGAFNPAVALGASVFGGFAWINIWIYLAGCFGGAALAAFTYKAVDC